MSQSKILFCREERFPHSNKLILRVCHRVLSLYKATLKNENGKQEFLCNKQN